MKLVTVRAKIIPYINGKICAANLAITIIMHGKFKCYHISSEHVAYVLLSTQTVTYAQANQCKGVLYAFV